MKEEKPLLESMSNTVNDVKQPSQTMEEVDNVSVLHDTLASASQLVEHDGNFLVPETVQFCFLQVLDFSSGAR